LVSCLDALLLAGRGAGAMLNLGGIANITVLGRDGSLIAYDTGPANALVDAVVSEQRWTPTGFDTDARLAMAGVVDPVLLQVLLDDPYYHLTPPRSTGKEHFHLPYLRDALSRAGTAPGPSDLVRTLVELSARTVADEVNRHGVEFLAASGGGCHNPVLMTRIRELLPRTEVVLTDQIGVPGDAKEAIAFAFLGWCTWHGLPGTIPTCTGASAPRVLGCLTPGLNPLVLPPAMRTPPTQLRLRDEGQGL
jgi:anhydro-N-acetylmuramic acid kinase